MLSGDTLTSKLDVRPDFDVSGTVTVVGSPEGSRLHVVAACRPGEHRMVEGVEKLRLQQEADPLRDWDLLGQRHVVVGLMRSIHVENLTECARRGVGCEIGGVGTDSRG